jgi:hypothetical protein
MTKHPVPRLLATLGLGLALVGAPALATAAPAAVAAIGTNGPVKADATTDPAPMRADAHGRKLSYAERDAANVRAADFNGDGSAIYIGGSTLAVVLIVVLVLVLL